MLLELAFAATHHAMPGDFNERHLEARLSFENGAFATAYHNSEDELSLGVGYRVEHTLSQGVNLFGEAALVTGYDYAPVLPMLRGGIEIKDRFEIWIAPTADTEGNLGELYGVRAVIGRW